MNGSLKRGEKINKLKIRRIINIIGEILRHFILFSLTPSVKREQETGQRSRRRKKRRD